MNKPRTESELQLKRIADSLEAIEHIITQYCTVQSMPSVVMTSHGLPKESSKDSKIVEIIKKRSKR